ncbi:hypothetical protein [Croceicoccus marinus]|uniref:Uncharacterized protein n=1 Tax=Croceicoccus marinus TaxID=450378 RepID=A0A1Z1FAB1_9SPHN|nr:hypothetical protein [Croceicoccus marinus]ARU15768.1 hypothetical protein A9D14_05710 [Croceicoccus marinus]
MADNETSSDTGMRAVVDNIGNPQPRVQNAEPELTPYLDRVYKMDPFDDVPGPVKVAPGTRFSPPTVKVLHEDDRHEILAALRDLPPEQRDEQESKLVLAKMREVAARQRAWVGVSDDALPYHQEQALIARQVLDIEREMATYQEQIDRVVFRTEYNEETGKNEPVEVPFLPQTRRDAYAAHIRSLRRHRLLLVKDDGTYGVEGMKRMHEAAQESAKALKAIDDARKDAEEVETLARQMVRDDRIKERARSRANILKNEVR